MRENGRSEISCSALGRFNISKRLTEGSRLADSRGFVAAADGITAALKEMGRNELLYMTRQTGNRT